MDGGCGPESTQHPDQIRGCVMRNVRVPAVQANGKSQITRLLAEVCPIQHRACDKTTAHKREAARCDVTSRKNPRRRNLRAELRAGGPQLAFWSYRRPRTASTQDNP